MKTPKADRIRKVMKFMSRNRTFVSPKNPLRDFYAWVGERDQDLPGKNFTPIEKRKKRKR